MRGCLALSALFLCLALAGRFHLAAGYKSEVQITPDPLDAVETTTKKSSWFGGFKKFFGSDATTTTTTPAAPPAVTTPRALVVTPTAAQKPPPLVISHAPLVPLGPRPDTPGSSPFGASPPPASGPQWPTTSARTPQAHPQPHPQPQPAQQPAQGRQQPAGGTAAPNLPPGFAPYRPQKPQPNSYDLSYGGGPGQGTRNPGFGLGISTTSSSTSTTTTQRTPTPTSTTGKPAQKEDFPSLPGPRRPSQKEDFPALPTAKTPPGSPTPTPGSPSAWQSPLPTPQHPVHPPTKVTQPPSPTPTATHSVTPTPTPAHGSSFGPHKVGGGGGGGIGGGATTTTVRPGFQSSGNSVATDDEIRQLTEQLYTKESNSQLGNIQVNLQGRTRSIDSADEAPNPLLNVDAKALESPTIAKMRLLFNNYEHDTLVNEHVTPNERKEENEFLDAVMATPVMRQAMLFLQQKGVLGPDPKTHRDLVKELWFTQYSRGQGKIGSSGFEHVFVHEVKDGTIIGFHNWVYIGEEEKGGRFDYKGYMKEQDIGTKGKVIKIRFSHQGINKPVNSLFVGTSPELELALYTVCFQLRPDRTCPVSLGNSRFGIVTYSWRYRGKNLIGSAYPEI
ncbi:poly(U)-specific endoribonuclease homolog [Drosophila ficusphila]|uniref:poly(U)-specific endoribonuclease homolog n=1 Tax=Drosophila ficusphila TaxID=30025 RepID=UPI0007E7CD9B|nr:poly(U)-specific endoribonuclease homolog [Drosophila ficusphila]